VRSPSTRTPAPEARDKEHGDPKQLFSVSWHSHLWRRVPLSQINMAEPQVCFFDGQKSGRDLPSVAFRIWFINYDAKYWYSCVNFRRHLSPWFRRPKFFPFCQRRLETGLAPSIFRGNLMPIRINMVPPVAFSTPNGSLLASNKVARRTETTDLFFFFFGLRADFEIFRRFLTFERSMFCPV
jgi:hypothetical protein